ncbi:MAG: phosphatase PAP2 family protein [Bacteroidales bacterium]|nr:phosphatase PAP2 family protein [Bacteroidales bacterium]
MRPIKITAFFLILLLQSCSSNDRQNTVETNLNKVGEITVTCPDAVKYLPDFPVFKDKDAFFNDSILYRRGYAMRDSERGRQAILDAGETLDFYLKRFGEVMGVSLSEEQNPAIARYIKTAYSFARGGISNAKRVYGRMRPFCYFGEPSGIPEDEEINGLFTSFPSGHSVRAWTIALALIAIDDEHEYDIINLGYELGQSRVITGFHYQSDVDAGRMAASVAFAKIVSDEEFIKLMNLAREELKGLRN